MWINKIQSITGHILEKKATSLKIKKGTFFFHFQGVHFFHATFMLMHEMSKIGLYNTD